MHRNHANSKTLFVQPSARMNLPCIICVTLLLNPTKSTPLT